MSNPWTRFRRERGEGKIGLIIAIAVVLLLIHVAMKIIPFKVETAEMEKQVENKLQELAGSLIDEDDYILAILDKAEELKIPLTEDKILVELQAGTYHTVIQYQRTLGMIWGDWTKDVDIDMRRTKF